MSVLPRLHGIFLARSTEVELRGRNPRLCAACGQRPYVVDFARSARTSLYTQLWRL